MSPGYKGTLSAQKSNNDSRFNIIMQKATNSLSFRIIASSFKVLFGGRGMD
jgi:hypothetical protein